MILMIISDLHIGINDPDNDMFRWEPEKFMHIMDCYIKKYKVDEVILNGDIYELYKYTFEEIQKAQPVLVDYLSQFVFIRGNHDSLSEFGQESWTHKNSRGDTLFIEHGHNVDWRNGSPSGRLMAGILYRILKNLVKFELIRKTYYRVVEWQDQLNRIPRKYDRYKYLNYALKLLLKYDTVILGHTHKMEYVKTYFINHKKRYMNSGTCCHGRFQGIILDTESSYYKYLNPRKSGSDKTENADESE